MHRLGEDTEAASPKSDRDFRSGQKKCREDGREGDTALLGAALSEADVEMIMVVHGGPQSIANQKHLCVVVEFGLRDDRHRYTEQRSVLAGAGRFVFDSRADDVPLAKWPMRNPFSLPSILPKRLVQPGRAAVAAGITARLAEASVSDSEKLLLAHGSSSAGLSQEEAEQRVEKYGANAVAQEEGHSWRNLLLMAVLNPLVILLSLLAILSAATGDLRAAIVMLLMVVLGVALRFVQEARADTAAAKLKAMIRVTATVVRDGAAREIALSELVPGDIVRLAAGDMIPADVRLLSCKDLFVIQASLTGESMPVEKFDALEASPAGSPLELKNICFLGTSVESGTATAIVVGTGSNTYLGSIAKAISGSAPRQALTGGSAGSRG